MMEIMRPRIELENGAYIIIEKTEALTTIDVNTGKFIGEDSLEETVYQTNILAAIEIARQVRLRNIGGIVVVDFIDMANDEHRNAVVETLKNSLATDRAKCKVATMSEFGLVEFTRKRVGVSPVNIMTNTCKYCGGAGDTRSQEFILFDVRARLLELLSGGNDSITIDMNYNLAHKLIAWSEMVESIKVSYPNAKITIVPHRTYHEDTITYTVAPNLETPQNSMVLY
jgi:ribonuclease G